ncbi:MAG: 4Fe-4S binding protein [Tepidanaerobacteraceae bacterium]|jgi:ferredoxin
MAYRINSECIACGACEPECPTDAIIKGEIYKTDEEECIECGACADICPVTAISPDD